MCSMSHYQKLFYFLFEAIVITSSTHKHPTQLFPLRLPLLLPKRTRPLSSRPRIIKRFGKGTRYVFSPESETHYIIRSKVTQHQFSLRYYFICNLMHRCSLSVLIKIYILVFLSHRNKLPLANLY